MTEAKRISLELGGEFGSAAIFPVLPVKLHLNEIEVKILVRLSIQT